MKEAIKAFSCPDPDATFSKGIAVVREYYEVKGYRVSVRSRNREAEFFFTKDSLYRKLIRKEPVIVGQWVYEDGQLLVRVFAKMDHGDGTVDSVVGRMLDMPLSVTNALVHKLTDPVFDKVFSDEFMLMSEAAANIERK